GLYQRNPGRTMAQTTARIVLSLMLAVPVAWAIFTLVLRAEAWNETLRLAVPLAFVGLVAIRGVALHSGMAPAFVRRALILGQGAEAASVEQSISELGNSVRFLGFFPAKKIEAAHQVAAHRIIGGGMDLVDTVRRYDIDEIVVAVRERRGGVLPLRELLDC